MNIHFFRQNEPPSPHDIRKKKVFQYKLSVILVKNRCLWQKQKYSYNLEFRAKDARLIQLKEILF